ncbi:MAG: DUF1992 domain-containing protein [Pirellulaceae bacterium]
MNTRKKPPHLSWESFAEQQIREAQETGQFENLPGFGKPLPLLDEPYDELWWVRRTSRRENLSLLPPALQIRVDVDRTLKRLAELPHEADVRRELEALNVRIQKANLSSAWGPASTTSPLDIDQTVAWWRQQRGADAPD